MTRSPDWPTVPTPMPANAAAAAAEALLLGLFAEVLNRDRVGPDDSLFGLSGDSIAVLKLVRRARSAGLPLTIRDVFEARTARALAAISAERGPLGRFGPDADQEPEDDEAGLDGVGLELSPEELAEIESEIAGDISDKGGS